MRFLNRVKQAATTDSSAYFTLGSAETYYVTLDSAGIVDGDSVPYLFEGSDGSWEFGRLDYTAPSTYLRAYFGSSSGYLLSAGVSGVLSVVPLAEVLPVQDARSSGACARTGSSSVAVGSNAQSLDGGTACGHAAYAAYGDVAIGNATAASDNTNGSNASVAIGQDANAEVNEAVAIGSLSAVTAYGGIALGRNAQAQGERSVALGKGVYAQVAGSLALYGVGYNCPLTIPMSGLIDASTTQALTVAGGGALSLGSGGAMAVDGVVGVQENGGTAFAAFKVQFAVADNGSGEAALVGTPTITSIGATAGFSPTLSVTVTTGSLDVTLLANNSTTVGTIWLAKLEAVDFRDISLGGGGELPPE